MGVDLSSGLHLTWTAWEYCFDVARAFGWEPEGTLPPFYYTDPEITPPPRPWDGGYFTNDYQTVSASDARAWAAALDRAVAALKGEQPATDEQRRVLAGSQRREAAAPMSAAPLDKLIHAGAVHSWEAATSFPDERAEVLKVLADAARRGGFGIG